MDTGSEKSSRPYAGADIDAVGAMHAVRRVMHAGGGRTETEIAGSFTRTSLPL
jgi:hypothetical protein